MEAEIMKLRIVRGAIFVAFVFATLTSVVIIVGLGAGFLLNYLVPTISLGSAAIAGVLAFGFATHFVMQGIAAHLDSVSHGAAYEAQDVDSELVSDEQVETIADQVSEAIMIKMGAWANRRAPSSSRSSTRSRRRS
jgi:hypothetical protein